MREILGRLAAHGGLGAIVLALWAHEGSAGEKTDLRRPVTFNRDVAPIVFKQCAACHRPGEVAPFALLTYQDVRKRARQIEEVTSTRYMPPWKPTTGHGEFLGERRLDDAEIATIAAWVADGLAEGDAADLPETPTFAAGWQLGQPDVVISMDESFEVPADGPDRYRNFVLPIEFPRGKYLKAAEFRPGNPVVVHHAVLTYDADGKARQLDAKEEGLGFERVGIVGKLFPGASGIWTPGREATVMPEGFSMPWPDGADLVLQLHLHPSGKVEHERSTVGLYLTDEPPARTTADLLLIDKNIDIPPGERAFRTHDEMVLPIDMELFGVFPHMHLIGREVRVTAEPPDGERKTLFAIDDWSFKWQNFYQYLRPVRLPAGTRIEMHCVHDNSADNAANPNQPPERVTWGEETRDEMSIVILQLVPIAPVTLSSLEEQLKNRIVGGVTASRPVEGAN